MVELIKALKANVYEPIPRKYGGRTTPMYVAHRFPIKNGISFCDVLARSNNNPLIKMIKESTP
jgi:hypothetical protein